MIIHNSYTFCYRNIVFATPQSPFRVHITWQKYHIVSLKPQDFWIPKHIWSQWPHSGDRILIIPKPIMVENKPEAKRPELLGWRNIGMRGTGPTNPDWKIGHQQAKYPSGSLVLSLKVSASQFFYIPSMIKSSVGIWASAVGNSG